MTWWLDSSDTVIVLGVIFSGFTGCLVAYCQQQRKSRCSSLSICFGCIKCNREIESDALVLAEGALEKQSNQPKQSPVPETVETEPQSGRI